MKTPLNDLSVYFIAGTQDVVGEPADRVAALLDLLDRALDAGIGCFQLREKGAKALQYPDDIRQLAEACLRRCRAYGVPLFINDDVDLALAIGADGVHVGQGDEAIERVIARCQGKLLIGLTINTLEQAKAASHIDGIDYFGVGAIYATTSKADAKAPAGTGLIEAIRAAGIDKPMVGIGGISMENAAAVRSAGADGVAVISAITQADDVAITVKALTSP
ncbi:thiamine phosphate synthase [Cardiobacteriaceae bacterium TAE3-ERU3]|nr:thiamine phosphate synthase [Cardiobacteriaceae bacterium TAE3-ERU3]